MRFTAGELFFPMPVDAYVQQASLWAVDPATGRAAVRIVEAGQLDLDRLSAEARARPNAQLQLRFVPGGLDRRQLREWRRDPDRPRFRGTSRFAAVGLLGRLVDSLFRLSLLLRGRVPGGITAAVHRAYRASPAASQFPYYAHVSVDGGYVVVQYWFFFAMNDWRSSFAGVNDHEADWEQVTLYLVPTDGRAPARAAGSPDGSDVLRLAWVAFSSHDEVGDDLRRRYDDPDIGWVDGTHPVVYAGAGSHSGAYLAGEYLVRVEPPSLQRVFGAVAGLRELLFPWTRDRPRTGFGIPYVDYKRGDGTQIGPGTDHPWTPVLVDDSTPWVRDYSGLWGLDTEDPFGGERAPAGPRHERNATVRESWGDPVAWAGLDKVPPTAQARQVAEVARLDELERLRAELDTDIERERESLRRLAAGAAILPPVVSRWGRGKAPLEEQTRRLSELQARRRAVVLEAEHLRQAQLIDPVDASPHAHLRRRAIPNLDPDATPGLLLRFWTAASLSAMLALFGVALLLDVAALPFITAAAVLLVMTVEAVLRRRLFGFLLGVAVVAALVVTVHLLVTNWREGLGVLAIVASLAIGMGNLRTFFAHR
jgi:hypothetical protein